MSKRRITQKDIAKAADVDASTVSLALRNHPSIPEATRERIRKCAEKLGYEPDPMLAALASYRSQLRPSHFQGSLAWLSNWDQFSWKTVPHFLDYFRGARERAGHYGFRLEEFDLKEPGMTPARISSILRARNISGILVCPQQAAGTSLEFPWEHFSAVTFGYSLVHPQLHLVATSHYNASTATVRQMVARGYKRIGFCLSSSHDEKVNHLYRAGYYTEMHMSGLEVLPLHDETSSLESWKKWIRMHKIDGIISGNFGGVEYFTQLGIPIPGKLGAACPSLGEKSTFIAGIVEHNHDLGEIAVDAVVRMIHRGERGIPKLPQRILVDGAWHEGKSLRPLARDACSSV